MPHPLWPYEHNDEEWEAREELKSQLPITEPTDLAPTRDTIIPPPGMFPDATQSKPCAGDHDLIRGCGCGFSFSFGSGGGISATSAEDTCPHSDSYVLRCIKCGNTSNISSRNTQRVRYSEAAAHMAGDCIT